ncbi:MAG: hypothetical protein D5R97_00555 [Candidatus Syntrophonatronum acetioxidans]|uniref:DUF1376 domain-containing protein n=1 Tax=Candidatus Syntrophonatronum acetioxidans TaxID=1795816 RepID=A0A424YIQ3_9FIRM|nr:MAG: hypothetical protein D5R97_00555 [Candidatus Syntrophonatronum acetioxidans]
MITPDFFCDEDLVRYFDFGGRLFFQGLWCVAEDSGVYQPQPLTLKMKIFPGDSLELKKLEGYLEKLLELGKVIEYQVGPKKLHYIKNFHKYQRIDKPSPPSLPLPPWLTWQGEEEVGPHRHRWKYQVDLREGDFENSKTFPRRGEKGPPPEVKVKERKESKEKEISTGCFPGETAGEENYTKGHEGAVLEKHQAKDAKKVQEKREAYFAAEGSKKDTGRNDIKGAEKVKYQRVDYPEDFEKFWQAYPPGRRMEKRAAYKAWQARLREGQKEGLVPEDLVRAAARYAREMKSRNKEPQYIKLPKTFLGSHRPFEDYLKEGEGVIAPGGDTPRAWNLLSRYLQGESQEEKEHG